MSKDTVDDLINEGKALLGLLPDPNINFHKDHACGVYAGNDIEVRYNGISGKPLVSIANCEFDDCADADAIREIHDSRVEGMDDEELIDEEFLKETASRNAEFFAASPDLIRRLIFKLHELKYGEQ